MNSNIVKIVAVLLSLAVICSSFFGTTASSSEVEELSESTSGVSLSVNSDKPDFDWGENIIFNATVNNSTNHTISCINIICQAEYDRYFEYSSDNMSDITVLNPSESQTIQIVFKSITPSFFIRTFLMPIIMFFRMFIPSDFEKCVFLDKETVEIDNLLYKFGFNLNYNASATTTTTKKAPIFTQEQPTVHEATTKSTTALSTQKVSSVASEFIVNVNNITASFSDCVATEDGGFVAAGATLDEDLAALIAKIDKKGNIDWVHEIKGNNMLAFECVEVLDNGSIIACGYSAATDLPELQGGYACTDTLDGLIMKFNKRGDLQWSKTIGGSGDDTIYSIEEAPDGSIYIGGNTSSRDGTFSKITADPKYRFSAFIIKYTDSDFDTIIDDCCAAFSTSFSSQTSDLSCADNGDLFAAVYAVKTDGDLASIGAGTTGAGKTIALKYDKNGTFQWSQIFWGSGQTRLSSILATNDGGCILGGSYSSKSNPGTGTFDGICNGGNTGTHDGVVIRLKSDGKIYWKETFIGFNQDVIEDIIETDSGFAVVGQSTSSNHDFYSMNKESGYDIFVYTISPLGRKQAMASLGGSNSDKALAACLLEDGSIAIAGNTCSDDGSFAGLTPAGSKTQAAATVAKFNLTIAE